MRTFKHNEWSCACSNPGYIWDSICKERALLFVDLTLFDLLTRNKLQSWDEAVQLNYPRTFWESASFTRYDDDPYICQKCRRYKWKIIPNPFYVRKENIN